MTNLEYLMKLAEESPGELRKWFESEYEGGDMSNYYLCDTCANYEGDIYVNEKPTNGIYCKRRKWVSKKVAEDSKRNEEICSCWKGIEYSTTK